MFMICGKRQAYDKHLVFHLRKRGCLHRMHYRLYLGRWSGCLQIP